MKWVFALCVFVASSAAFGAVELPASLRTAGKAGTVVLFLSAHCPCSQDHEARLAELARTHGDFAFRAYFAPAERGTAETHFAERNLPFSVVEDRGARFAEQFGASKTPHAFVFDAEGQLRYQGAVDDSHEVAHAERFFLAGALTALRAGRAPEPARTRPLGCPWRGAGT